MKAKLVLKSMVVAVACLRVRSIEPAAAQQQQYDRQYYSQVYRPYPNPSYYPWAYGAYGGLRVVSTNVFLSHV